MVHLADANVLIALVVPSHVHHGVAHAWFEDDDGDLATCPITEGALVRFLVREGAVAATVATVLDQLRSQPWHQFWPDDVPYDGSMLDGVIGHRQVTDAYLVALATANGARLVTLDKGLAELHGSERVELIAT